MTHDPLCDWRPCTCPLNYDVPERGHMIGCPEDDCECEIIAKVRADQVERDATIVQGFGWSPETDDADIRQVIAELRQ